LSNDPIYLAGRQRVIEGMRLAGVPEARGFVGEEVIDLPAICPEKN
jgi:hypothetical protein